MPYGAQPTYEPSSPLLRALTGWLEPQMQAAPVPPQDVLQATQGFFQRALPMPQWLRDIEEFAMASGFGPGPPIAGMAPRGTLLRLLERLGLTSMGGRIARRPTSMVNDWILHEARVADIDRAVALAQQRSKNPFSWLKDALRASEDWQDILAEPSHQTIGLMTGLSRKGIATPGYKIDPIRAQRRLELIEETLAKRKHELGPANFVEGPQAQALERRVFQDVLGYVEQHEYGHRIHFGVYDIWKAFERGKTNLSREQGNVLKFIAGLPTESFAEWWASVVSKWTPPGVQTLKPAVQDALRRIFLDKDFWSSLRKGAKGAK